MKLTFIFYSCFFSKTDNATNKKHPLLGIDTADDGRQGMLESTYTLLEAINFQPPQNCKICFCYIKES